LTLVDATGERTITTLGPRLEPSGADAGLGLGEIAGMDAVYFTAGDAGALRAARAARTLVASPRAHGALGEGIGIDALILSSDDETESGVVVREPAEGAELVAVTAGAQGGSWRTRDGDEGGWAAVLPPGPIVDTYGCGDAFAAGVTYGLAAELGVDAAIELGARCAAVTIAGEGPYGRELTPALVDYPLEPPDDD
jgi:ribokinase